MDGVPPRIPIEVEAVIKAAIADPQRGEASLLLASIANRATAALHQVARAEAAARKGQPEWGRWAALTNISRDAVLRTAASRQSASQLAQAGRNSAVMSKDETGDASDEVPSVTLETNPG